MSEHTPTPWHTDEKMDPSAVYDARDMPVVATFGGNEAEYRANAAFIVKAVNSHDALVKSLEAVIDANREFRAGMPDGWEGDPLQDACEAAEDLLAAVGGSRDPA